MVLRKNVAPATLLEGQIQTIENALAQGGTTWAGYINMLTVMKALSDKYDAPAMVLPESHIALTTTWLTNEMNRLKTELSLL